MCPYTHLQQHTNRPSLMLTRFTALCPGLPGSAGTRKVKPIWILLKQEIVSGSGISWAICKSAPRSRHLPPNQQRQSTEGTLSWHDACIQKKQYAIQAAVTACICQHQLYIDTMNISTDQSTDRLARSKAGLHYHTKSRSLPIV